MLSKCERDRYKSVECVCVKRIPLQQLPLHGDGCRQCEAVSATTLSSSLIAYKTDVCVFVCVWLCVCVCEVEADDGADNAKRFPLQP